jgi:hypothetical protein
MRLGLSLILAFAIASPDEAQSGDVCYYDRMWNAICTVPISASEPPGRCIAGAETQDGGHWEKTAEKHKHKKHKKKKRKHRKKKRKNRIARHKRHKHRRSPAFFDTIDKEDSLHLWHFRLTGLGAFQAEGRSYSINIGWHPEYRWDTGWTLGGAFSWMLLETFPNLITFHVLDYQIMVGRRFKSSVWGVEAGGGIQTWATQGGTHPIATVNAIRYIQEKPWDRLVISYSYFAMPGIPTHEIRVGVGVSF